MTSQERCPRDPASPEQVLSLLPESVNTATDAAPISPPASEHIVKRIPQYLYVLGASREGPLKIGIAKNPHKRLATVQTGSHVPMRIFWVYPCPHGATLEPIVHRILGHSRLNGEWFDIPVEEAIGAIWAATFDDGKEWSDADILKVANHVGLWLPQMLQYKSKEQKS